jgi:hypothetical protein
MRISIDPAPLAIRLQTPPVRRFRTPVRRFRLFASRLREKREVPSSVTVVVLTAGSVDDASEW